MYHGIHLGHLLVGEEGIATGKVHNLVAQVAHATARANTAIGHYVAIHLGKMLEHHIVEGQGEGSTCA